MLHSLGLAIKMTHESESMETNCTIIHFLFPLQQVNTGSIADKAGLQAGDAVVRVNATDLYTLRHKDAQDAIVKAGPSFELIVQRFVMIVVTLKTKPHT
jgi:C-terminal processing protease CtpA/Prc